MKKKNIIIFSIIVLIGIGFLVYWFYPHTLELPEDVDTIQFQYGEDIYELNEEQTQVVMNDLQNWEIYKGHKARTPYSGGITVEFFKNQEVIKKLYIVNLNEIYENETDNIFSICYQSEASVSSCDSDSKMHIYSYFVRYAENANQDK